MKIGLVFDDSLDRNDGVQQYVRTLGSWLSAENHEVHYLVGQTHVRAPHVYSLSKNISMRFNGNRFTIPLWASGTAIRKLLKHERYDILHIQMPYSPVLAGKIIAGAPAATAIVGTFHVMPVGKLQIAGNYMLGKLQKRSLSRFNAICSVSPAAQQFALRAYGIKTQVIPNMINTAEWKNSIQPQPHHIVFLGRLVPRKGCKELLRALAVLPAPERQGLSITIGGTGPERTKLEKIARKTSLDVSFPGYIAEKDKLALLASADLAIFPSTGGESFGIVLLEAMAASAGIVIGGDNPGYRSVLGDLPASLIDFTTHTEAVRRLGQLLQDKALRRQLHTQQQKLIKTYDVLPIGQQITAMYQTALLHRRQDVR